MVEMSRDAQKVIFGMYGDAAISKDLVVVSRVALESSI